MEVCFKNIKELLLEEVTGGELGRELRLLLLVRDSWKGMLGERLYSHAKPYRIVRDTLLVAVDSSAWLQELLFAREDIKKEISKITKGQVKEVIFKVKHKPHL